MTVACALPNGLIIYLCEKYTVSVPVLGMGGGTREEIKHREKPGTRVRIFGNAMRPGMFPQTRVVAGYALTSNVPRVIWEGWLEVNKNQDVVRNKLIFAYPTVEAAASAARDHRGTKSGLEPLDPDGDPRRPRSPNKFVKEVTKEKPVDDVAA